MTVHFTEGKHITLPIQPEGERVQWRDKKRIPKQGSKGSQWSPDAVCLKAAKTLARVPHTTREGHRGLLRATGGSGDPSQNICETNWQRRRKLFPWWSKMFLYYSIYVFGWLTFTRNVSLKKFFRNSIEFCFFSLCIGSGKIT